MRSKNENYHTGGGGVRKVQKKCHVLFEWPFYGNPLKKIKLELFYRMKMVEEMLGMINQLVVSQHRVVVANNGTDITIITYFCDSLDNRGFTPL